MTLVSLAAYGALHDASRQAAGNWKRTGALLMDGDLVDVERSDAKMKGAGLGRFRVSGHGGRRQKGVRGAIDRPGLDPLPAPEIAEMADAKRTYNAMQDAYRKASPFAIGIHIEREIARLTDAARKGTPLDFAELRDLADTVLHCERELECGAFGWLEWAVCKASEIASDLGIGPRSKNVGEVLAKHVRLRLETQLFFDIEHLRCIVAAVSPDLPNTE